MSSTTKEGGDSDMATKKTVARVKKTKSTKGGTAKKNIRKSR